jgi:hypothetical protein
MIHTIYQRTSQEENRYLLNYFNMLSDIYLFTRPSCFAGSTENEYRGGAPN